MGNHRNKGKSLIGFPEEYIVVDIETTGLKPESDSIIELGAIKCFNHSEIARFESLVKPDKKINSFITELTGITNEMVKEAPDIKTVLGEFIKFAGDHIIVGYNVNFDINFIYDECIEQLGYVFNNNFIDALRIARKLYPEMEHHRLIDMVNFYNIEIEGAHRAIYDCLSTNECFLRMHEEVLNQYLSINQFKSLFR